jgi:hypothetical protein
LLLLEFALEDGFARNLSGITKGKASSKLWLDLKKKGSIVLANF